MNVRNTMTIIVLPEIHMFHFCQQPLAGIASEAWYPYCENELFKGVEKFLVAANVAHNVVSISEKNRCGKSVDYTVTYNAVEPLKPFIVLYNDSTFTDPCEPEASMFLAADTAHAEEQMLLENACALVKLSVQTDDVRLAYNRYRQSLI